LLDLLIAQNSGLPPLQHPQPATQLQFRLGAVLQHSTTPSLRVAGFEDEDDDEYENEAPCEGDHVGDAYPGLKPWAVLSDHFVVKNFLGRVSICRCF
jgi:hypothetical protein